MLFNSCAFVVFLCQVKHLVVVETDEKHYERLAKEAAEKAPRPPVAVPHIIPGRSTRPNSL
jgi:hypothetical protein